MTKLTIRTESGQSELLASREFSCSDPPTRVTVRAIRKSSGRKSTRYSVTTRSDGMFFDEAPTDCNASNPFLPTRLLYYEALTNYVREKAGARITLLNPGTYSASDCWDHRHPDELGRPGSGFFCCAITGVSDAVSAPPNWPPMFIKPEPWKATSSAQATPCLVFFSSLTRHNPSILFRVHNGEQVAHELVQF